MGDPITAGIAGLLVGGAFVTFAFAGIFAWVLYIVAYWKVFKKMGEPGWKCIIPVYNEYILFKHTWSTSMFWIYLIIAVVGGVCYSMGVSFDAEGNVQAITNMPMASIGSVLLVVTAAISIVQLFYLSKSFGHGLGYTIGLIFLSFIFVLILGFGSSRYIGPMGQRRDDSFYLES